MALEKKAHLVVAAVGVEVGAVVRRDGQLQVLRRLRGRPAERPFGGDVHHVWPVLGPQLHQRALGRHAHAQIGVERHRQAAR